MGGGGGVVCYSSGINESILPSQHIYMPVLFSFHLGKEEEADKVGKESG